MRIYTVANNTWIQSSQALTPKRFQDVEVVYDHVARSVEFFFDGDFAGRHEDVDFLGPVNNDDIVIGCFPMTMSHAFEGVISRIHVLRGVHRRCAGTTNHIETNQDSIVFLSELNHYNKDILK